MHWAPLAAPLSASEPGSPGSDWPKPSGLDSGTLVFFTFMPLGAAIGGIGGALLFAVVAIHDAEIVIERQPLRQRDR